MKRIALLAVIGSALVALPGTASAVSDCSYAGAPTAGPVTVYTDGGSLHPDAIAGVCVDLNQGQLDGGYAEVGSGDSGAYGVIDGSDVQPGQAAGYGAITTGYETGETESACDQNDSELDPAYGGSSPTAGGTNSGGCFAIRGVTQVEGVPLACGNTTGPDYFASSRDGCTAP